MTDVKELIPEFFYLPEFLKNSNHFDLGAYCTYNLWFSIGHVQYTYTHTCTYGYM